MREWLAQWWRYPFAVAGPVSWAANLTIATAGVVSALTLPPLWQFWPGFVAFVGWQSGSRLARRGFMKKRDIIARVETHRSRREQAAIVAGAGVAPLIALIALGWSLAWYWPLWSALTLGLELKRREKWAKAGYPGDPRWARDWSVETDPAYEFRAISRHLSGQYPEAQRLFEKALASDPGNALLLYNLGCSDALAGDADAALRHVNEAAKIDPRLRERAETDRDLVSIRDDPRFLR